MKEEKRLIRAKEVRHKTGLPVSSIYDKMAKGQFPQKIKIGPRQVVWVESEIDEWIQNVCQSARKPSK